MTTITFYEKPGCAGNAKQRALLQAAGHTLVRKNLLTEPWTAESLLDFLLPRPVPAWFNRSAPRIKSGALVPESLDAESALAELLAEPLLIRRPLMQRDDGARMVGFEMEEVRRFVDLGASTPGGASMEGCAAIVEDQAPG